MSSIKFDDIAEWQFWAHPKAGSDICYQYPPAKINLAIRQREKLLKDESMARVEPIIGITVQELKEIENEWKEMGKLAEVIK